MKNKLGLLLLTLTLLIAVMPFSLASLGTYAQYSCVNVQTILNTTSVNLTTIWYNTTILVDGELMSKRGYAFNYTFCNTSKLGTYIYDYVDASGNVYVNDFEITITGTTFTIQQAIIYIIALVLLIAIFILCLYGAIVIPWADRKNPEGVIIGVNEFKYIKLFCIIFCYILLMFIFGVSRSVTANFLMYNNASQFFNFAYWFMLSCLFPIIAVSFILTIVQFVTGKKMKKILQRGIPIR